VRPFRSNGLAWATVRARPASFAGTFVALLFASVIVTACGVLLQNGATVSLPPERYAAPPVLVAADQNVTITYRTGDEQETESQPLTGTRRIDIALAERIAARPGIAEAVPDWSFPVRSGTAELAGRPWSAVRITSHGRAPLVRGREPAVGEVVLDTSLARAGRHDVGGSIALTTAQGTRTYRVAGLADGEGTAWFTAAEATALFGHPGQADAIAVFAERGVSTERLARQVAAVTGDTAKVHTGDDRAVLEHPEVALARETLSGLGGSFGGIAMIVAIFVVLGSVALAIGQRAHEIALLRAIGATPRQIRRSVAVEAMIVAPVAGAVGAVPGIALAAWWFRELRERGALPEGMSMTVSWVPILVAILSGLIPALIGGWLAARRPARAKPSQALGESAVRRRRPGIIRTLLGVAVTVGGVLLARVAVTASGEQAAESALGVVMLFMVAVALLGPIVAWASSVVLGAALRLAGAVGELAAVNTRADARRLASAITPIVLTVSFTGTLLFVQSTVGKATSEQARAGVVAEHVLTGTGAGLPEDTADLAQRVPGVGAAVGVLRSEVIIRSGNSLVNSSAIGLGGRGGHWPEVLDLGMTEGRLSEGPGTLALDRLLAQTVKVGVGDRVEMFLPDGTRIMPTVTAIYERGLGLGQAVLPRETLAGHLPHRFDAEVFVRDKPGADHTAVRDTLRRELDARVPGLSVSPRTAFATKVDAGVALNAWANVVMAAVLGGYAAIAAVNTLVMVMLDRRPEIALLRLAGATRRQTQRMVLCEAILVTATGLLLGGAILAVTLVPVARGLTGGSPYVPLGTAVTIAAAVIAIGLASAVLPTRALLRTPPAATVITE
jgi:putative ABC transport system permease protein